MDLMTLMFLKAAGAGKPKGPVNLLNVKSYQYNSGIYAPNVSNGRIDDTSIASGNGDYIVWSQVFPAGTYTFSFKYKGTGLKGVRFLCTKEIPDSSYLSFYHSYWKDLSGNEITIELDEEFSIGICELTASGHATEPGIVYDIMFETGDTAHEYVPYIEENNLVNYGEFLKNTNLTVDGFEVYGTNYNFRNDAQKYMLKETIPAGSVVKVSSRFYSENNDGDTGGLVFRLGYAGSDDYLNVCTFVNSQATLDVGGATVTVSQDCDNLQFGWNTGYNTVMHLRDLVVEVIKFDKNIFSMDEFAGLNHITYVDGVASATSDHFNCGGHCYNLTETIPAGKMFKVKATAKVTDGGNEDTWGLRIQAFFSDNTNTDFWHFNELDTDWTTMQGTYTLAKDVIGLRFSYANYPNSVWHLKDIVVGIPE